MGEIRQRKSKDAGRRQAQRTNAKKTHRPKQRSRGAAATAKDKHGRTNDANVPTVEQPDEDGEDTESARDIVLRHPLFWGLVLIGIPYAVHLGRRFVLLQKPQWIRPFVGRPERLRSTVSMTCPRQLLVVGSIASATSQVAHELSDAFDMEIGHEDTDSMWQFVRDGTVSWFHGIRYMDPKHGSAAVPSLCEVGFSFYKNGPSNNYGFGPTIFGSPNYTRSFLHPAFKDNWTSECRRLLGNEYGCAVVQHSMPDKQQQQHATASTNCTTPFQRTLVLTRHPRKIVTSLINKYCNRDGELAPAPKALLRFLVALFAEEKGNEAVEMMAKAAPDACPWQMAHYVLWWYGDILLPRVRDGTINGMFAVESSGVCTVGQLAGLDDISSTVYAPNHDAYLRYCGINTEDTIERRQMPFGQTKNLAKTKTSKKLGLVLPGRTDDEAFDMESRIDQLARSMGY